MIDQDRVKNITIDFESGDSVPGYETEEYARKLGCMLLDKYPEVIVATTADLDELTDENWHSTRRTIEFLKEEYANFLKIEKLDDFRRFRKC